MVFLRREGEEAAGRLTGDGVFLRHPDVRDFVEWSELREESRAFLTPWEPTWPEDELSRGAYRQRVKRYLQDIEDGKAYPFYVFRSVDGRLVGGATLSQVRRGAAQAATLGYWVGQPYQRRGYTSAAVRAVVRFAFEDLDLHRVEAACQPDNLASQGVLAKAGFEKEGHARAYLKINGAWRDHFLYARVKAERVR
ncbi:MAG: GNAT family N-acetyltransferase [Hyphomonadaceae bacterium]